MKLDVFLKTYPRLFFLLLRNCFLSVCRTGIISEEYYELTNGIEKCDLG